MAEKTQIEEKAENWPTDQQRATVGPDPSTAKTTGMMATDTDFGRSATTLTFKTPESSAENDETSQTEIGPMLARAERILTQGPGANDYLLVEATVRTEVDHDLEYARSRVGSPDLSPEVHARQLHQRLLAAHYGGQNIAYITDTTGVVVLAVGLDQINRLINEIPYSKRKSVVFGAPDVWW
ncbi:hypothetical protein [Fimbriiglobus ruber]|uniref:hypothetical protein n=1 Tax=Fimbriiglobus ruber TaxID=1908690 RepID=UPI000B4B8ECB|nr:hypothetical protein [Fimbriiglobus ruber]